MPRADGILRRSILRNLNPPINMHTLDFILLTFTLSVLVLVTVSRIKGVFPARWHSISAGAAHSEPDELPAGGRA